jgi:hypothetical protein
MGDDQVGGEALGLEAHGGAARHLAAVKIRLGPDRKIQDPRRTSALELPALDDRGRNITGRGTADRPGDRALSGDHFADRAELPREIIVNEEDLAGHGDPGRGIDGTGGAGGRAPASRQAEPAFARRRTRAPTTGWKG